VFSGSAFSIFPCVGFEPAASFNRVWAGSWVGQTNTHRPLQAAAARKEDRFGCNTGTFSSCRHIGAAARQWVWCRCVCVCVGGGRGVGEGPPGGTPQRRVQEEAHAAFTGQTGNHQAPSAHYAATSLPARGQAITRPAMTCRCRPRRIRGSLYSPRWCVSAAGVHLSHFRTIAVLPQCVVSSNRSVKWMEAEDGANNDALCLPAIRRFNVPLITVPVCLCLCMCVCLCVCVCVRIEPKGYWWPCAVLLYRLSRFRACVGRVSIQPFKQVLRLPCIYEDYGVVEWHCIATNDINI